jgi:SAM-dependent methyltransferase
LALHGNNLQIILDNFERALNGNASVKNNLLTGFWSSADIYQSVTGLPVLRSLRSATASLIRNRINVIGKQNVLSIGLGTGEIYKHTLKDEIAQGKLRVVAIDISDEMIEHFAKEFQGNSKIVLDPYIPQDNQIILSQRNILNGLDLPDNSIDIIEAILVLHHISYSNQLNEIIKLAYRILKKNGVLIIGDIDLDIGSYVEKKEAMLREKYSDVVRNSQNGFFFCKSPDGQTVTIPILDENEEEDKNVINRMMAESFNFLRKEAEKYGTKETMNAIDTEIESALKGGELNRSINEWIDIVKSGFGEYSKIEILNPIQIRKIYPDVLDRPFMLIVEKK